MVMGINAGGDRDTETETVLIMDHHHVSKPLLFLPLSFSLRLSSLSSHTTAQPTTLSTVAPFVLPYKEIFSPGCLCHCCYELHSVVQRERELLPFNRPLNRTVCNW